jgi:hypothetical protein
VPPVNASSQQVSRAVTLLPASFFSLFLFFLFAVVCRFETTECILRCYALIPEKATRQKKKKKKQRR